MLRGTDTIAGSTLTMDAAVRHAVTVAGLPLLDAVRAATTTPADLVGRPDLGRLAVGAKADLVVLDDRLVVEAVLRRGRLVLGGLESAHTSGVTPNACSGPAR